jgi:hypothetical protein
MPGQMRFLNKSFIAQLTAKGPLASMNSHMILQQLIPRKWPLTHCTHVDPLTAVEPAVAGQLLSTAKCPLTELTLVQGAVHAPLVVLEVLALLEGLAAGVALVRLLACVNPRMVLQVGRMEKCLFAHRTFVRLQAGMDF